MASGTTPGDFMGGYHFVTTLDFLQHRPTCGSKRPLFYFAGVSSNDLLRRACSMPKDVAGHHLWQQVDTIVMLETQHRFSQLTPGGKALWELVQILWSTDTPTKAKVCAIATSLHHASLHCPFPLTRLPALGRVPSYQDQRESCSKRT